MPTAETTARILLPLAAAIAAGMVARALLSGPTLPPDRRSGPTLPPGD